MHSTLTEMEGSILCYFSMKTKNNKNILLSGLNESYIDS